MVVCGEKLRGHNTKMKELFKTPLLATISTIFLLITLFSATADYVGDLNPTTFAQMSNEQINNGFASTAILHTPTINLQSITYPITFLYITVFDGGTSINVSIYNHTSYYRIPTHTYIDCYTITNNYTTCNNLLIMGSGFNATHNTLEYTYEGEHRELTPIYWQFYNEAIPALENAYEQRNYVVDWYNTYNTRNNILQNLPMIQ